MANKMIDQDDLRDSFLSALTRSEEQIAAPDGFMDGIMNRIGLLQPAAKFKPYQPPVWLKWGVPGVIAVCMTAILFWGPKGVPKASTGVSILEKTSHNMTGWFNGLKPDINFPEIHFSATWLWVLGGSTVLTWGFWCLSRFLEKRMKHS